MSARQTRLPTGKSNVAIERSPFTSPFNSARPLSARTPRLVPTTQQFRINSRPTSARERDLNTLLSPIAKDTFDGEPETHSARSNHSTNEFLLLKSKAYTDRMAQLEKAANEQLGEYNEYSRPRPSTSYALRSAMLDPNVNNFKPSKTRSELMNKIKASGIPHRSYDIDGDGWVSRDDYVISKRFDLDGNGVLDTDEKLIAKKIVAEEFFRSHMHHIHLFGKKFIGKSFKENVQNLITSKVFERTYSRLKATELRLKQSGSIEMIEGMTIGDQRLLKYNFYNNKFDSSAWNDNDAIPRAESFMLPINGSRKKLLFQRKQDDMIHNKEIFDDKYIISRYPRVNLISDMAVEND
jgi:hypothetical protein